MEARELRLGNYLDYYGQYVIVLEIKRNENIECGYFNDSIGFERKLSENHSPKPIPLTEDWLLRFGFEKTDFYDDVEACYILVCSDASDIYVTFNEGVFSYGLGYQDFNKEMPYVHTFQNYFYALNDFELSLKQTTEVNQ